MVIVTACVEGQPLEVAMIASIVLMLLLHQEFAANAQPILIVQGH